MPTVVNLRGTNGSGKSYLVRGWMEKQAAVPYPRRANLLGGDSLNKRPEYYVLRDGGIVIGEYTTDCGGCDWIDSTDLVKERIRQAEGRNPRYILFEGVIISTVFETWREFSREVGGMIWVYLNTPLKVCLSRAYNRNRGKEIKEQLVANKVKAIESTRLKAEQAGERVVVLNWENAVEEFAELIKSL